MCKDILVLLEHKTLGNANEKCVKSFENVHSHPIKWGTKLLFTYRQVVARTVELGTFSLLLELYALQGKCTVSERKWLDIKKVNIVKKIGDWETATAAICFRFLGSIFESLGRYVMAKEKYEEALAFAEKIGDRESEAKCYRDLGGMFRSLGQYIKAKEHSEKALAIAEKVGDRQTEDICHRYLGSIFQSLGEYVKAKKHFEKALAIAEKIGDRRTEAKCYRNLGGMFAFLGEYVKAKEHCEKAFAIAEKVGDRQTAICHKYLGNIFGYLGECVKAKEHFEKALAIAEKIGDGKTEATCYAIQGSIFQRVGEYVKAKEHYEKAFAIAEKFGDTKTEAKCIQCLILGNSFHSFERSKTKKHSEKGLAIAEKFDDNEKEATCYVKIGNISLPLNGAENVTAQEPSEKAPANAEKTGDRETEADSHESLGCNFFSHHEYVKAKEHFEKAIAIAEKIGYREKEARCYVYLGNAIYSLGEYVKAKEHYEKAIAIAEKIGCRETEATSYRNLASVFYSLGEYVKAKEHHRKVLAIAEKIGDREKEAKCYGDLGSVFHCLGEYVEAKQHLEKAVAIAAEIGDREKETTYYAWLGHTLKYLGECVKDKECFQKSCVLKQIAGPIEIESHLHLIVSAIMLRKGNISEAKSNAFVSLNKVEVMRRLQVHDKFKISYFDTMISSYRWLMEFLSEADPYEAFYADEFRRARALTDLMAARYSVENEISVSPRTWDDVQSIVKKECDCSCLYVSYYEQLIHLWLVKAGNPLIHRQMKVNDVFGSVSSVADLFCLEIYREVLCLAPEQCEDRSWLPSNVYWEQGCERPIIEDEDENQQPELTLADLYKMIIAPVTDSLNEREIIIVPDRLFYKVPFAALEEESGKCLSESFRIRIVPSLTTLKLIQDSPADYHSQSGVLIVGDPAVGEVLYKEILQRVKRLPFANKEAEMIGKLFGTQPLLGKQATKQAVLQNIHSVSLIHFACHGNAERGEIVLAPPPVTDRTPQEEDYLLTMEDISKVQLRAKLVVLSCCHSAKGQISAEGVVGIARAFLGSGARSVLAALWAIEDEATEQFMSRFYENLVRGQSASESLQQAMKWMRENGFSKVTQWAPFMLIGDNVTLDIHKLRSPKGQ